MQAELILLFFLVFALPAINTTHGQLPVEIISPHPSQVVPVGNLTMVGTSADNASTYCQVFADWNDTKPFQNVIATGSGGANDYSNWTFTYNKDYHDIAEGANKLTANLLCFDNSNAPAYSSVNITAGSPTIKQVSTQQSSDDNSKQSSDDDISKWSDNDPFQFVVFCTTMENGDDENGDDENGDDENGDDGDRVKIVDKDGNGFEDDIEAEKEKRDAQGHGDECE